MRDLRVLILLPESKYELSHERAFRCFMYSYSDLTD
jgi:hypothetical protein